MHNTGGIIINPAYNGTADRWSSSYGLHIGPSALQFNGKAVALQADVNAALASKADSLHDHAASNITSGTLSSDRLPTVPITKGGTGATTAEGALTNLGLTATAAELNYCDGVTSNIQTQLSGKAPTSHASTANTYGIGTGSNYGHVKLSDSTSSTSSTSSGIAATPAAVKAAYELANTAKTTADSKAASSHTHNYAASSSAGGAATTVAVTNTTPASATTYYPLYATGTSGSQTVRANSDLYYYDTGSASYFNVGSASQLGGLTLHQNNGYYANIVPGSLTTNRTITLPNVDGTVITTGNLPAAATTSAAGLMSAADKTKLDGIATGANAYTLPNATSSTLGGVKVGSNISVSSGTISLTKANVTSALGYTPPTTNTTYNPATQSANGLMSSTDKKKLDNISYGTANPSSSTTGYGVAGALYFKIVS